MKIETTLVRIYVRRIAVLSFPAAYLVQYFLSGYFGALHTGISLVLYMVSNTVIYLSLRCHRSIWRNADLSISSYYYPSQGKIHILSRML
jgi:hypothetical protein